MKLRKRKKSDFCEGCVGRDAIITYLTGRMRHHAIIAEQDRKMLGNSYGIRKKERKR